MRSAPGFYVFDTWRDAPSYAFGRQDEAGLVPQADRDAYWAVYQELVGAAEAARATSPEAAELFLRPKQYSHQRGSRGHRPKDLWVSVCARGAELLGFMPQVYAIASHRGLEIGFAASISEDDYFDPEVKERNRTIVPFINSKLPAGGSPLAQTLGSLLAEQGGWHFNAKTRLDQGSGGFDEFPSLNALLGFLRDAGEETGGGTICRVFGMDELASVDLDAEFAQALNNFTPLLARCAPTPWDVQVRKSQLAVEDLGGEVQFDPLSEPEGKTKMLAEVARRQGQRKFRNDLLAAYGGTCAITGTKVADVLQAAHIRPYNGPKTNHVTNGLLLRADVHNLFDLKLLTIEPNSMAVALSPSLMGTTYRDLDGQPLMLPVRAAERPSTQALADHFKSALG